MNFEHILKCFPKTIKEILSTLSQEEIEIIEEIRVRSNLPIILKLGQAEKIIDYRVNTEEMNYIFQKICENSVYTYQNQIASGYITLQGGNRVGIVGTAVMQNGRVSNLNYISSFNFRISRQIIGSSNSFIDELIEDGQTIYNTLIVASPGLGKTTILRDIVRNISNGIDNKLQGLNVSVIDERGEIAGSYKGVMQNDLGIRTDVISDIPKSVGIIMSVRSMAPQVIVADEIGSKEDIESIQIAMCLGVKGIFTVHGKNLEDVKQNVALRELIQENTFQKIIEIMPEHKYAIKTI